MPVIWTRILLWYAVWLRAAAISGLASATERSRQETSPPWPGTPRLGTPMSWPALLIAAPPEFPCAIFAVVSSSKRGSLTCLSGSGTNVSTTPLVTVIESDPDMPGKPSVVTFWSS